MELDTPPSWEPIWLRCAGCGYCWTDFQPVRAPLATWTAHVSSYRCQKCGAGIGAIYLRAKPPEEPPP